MSVKEKIRTISFDKQAEIVEAIRNRETFEVGGCQGRMSDAVLFLERTIGVEGLDYRVYTKGRTAAMLVGLAFPIVGIATAAALAVHNLATMNPDYEIMKRPFDGALLVSFMKNEEDEVAETGDRDSADEALPVTDPKIMMALKEQIERAAIYYTEADQRNDFVLCMVAFGSAIAGCDGDVDAAEKGFLRDFVVMNAVDLVPANIQLLMKEIATTPPTFDVAASYADKLDSNAWPVIDSILAIVSEADGVIKAEEDAFLARWTEFKASRMDLDREGIRKVKEQTEKEVKDVLSKLENDYPGITEGLATAVGSGLGGAGSLAALSALGFKGLSAAGITSGLAHAGALVGGGMVTGIGVLAAPIAGLGIVGYVLAMRHRNAKLAAALGQAIGRLYDIQSRLMANAEAFKEEIAGIKVAIDMLIQKAPE